jgi:hypothetical protein
VELFPVTQHLVSSSSPRPVVSFIFTLAGASFLTAIFGAGYYYGFIFTLDAPLKNNLLFVILNPLWFFYYGVQGLGEIFQNYSKPDYFLISGLWLFIWYFLLRTLTFWNKNSYARQRYKEIKEKVQKGREERKVTEGSEFNDSVLLFLLVLGVIILAYYIIFHIIPWVIDLLLQIIISTSAFILLTVTVQRPGSATGSGAALRPARRSAITPAR